MQWGEDCLLNKWRVNQISVMKIVPPTDASYINHLYTKISYRWILYINVKIAYRIAPDTQEKQRFLKQNTEY